MSVELLYLLLIVCSFVVGYLSGKLKKEWNEFMDALKRINTITDNIAETLETLAVLVSGLSNTVNNIRKAVEDGRIEMSEVQDIIKSWEKFQRALMKLKENIENLKSAIGGT